MRLDYNDYVYFAEVVSHGGFAAAGRALGIPKSKLSRRVTAIEARLGLRLIERSSRRFRVTEVGQGFHERCRAMMIEAERAEALVAEAQGEPHGRIRMTCPAAAVEMLSPALLGFLARYPKVSVQIVATNRAIDLIDERVDVALRVRETLVDDQSLTMRTLGRSSWILVAGPDVAERLGPEIASIADVPTLGTSDDHDDVEWSFHREDGATYSLRHRPRLACADFSTLGDAAAAGLGVAYLPDHACMDLLASGRLVRLFPDWRGREAIVHLVFTTRRGLPPAVRALIDHLAATFPTT